MHVASLHLYPLKSCAPLDAEALDVTLRGPVGDRRWMAVDANGRFLTARQHPRLVGIRALPDDAGIVLSANDMPALHVQPPANDAPRREVVIWDDTVHAVDAGDNAAAWLTQYLGLTTRLVHMDATVHRPVDAKYGKPDDEVSFADGYPLLVITQSALDELNARLASPVPMARFRPNIVVASTAPNAEDGWRRVRVGEVEFDAVKTCIRCVFTTIDPATMTRDPGGEPLRTLLTYRRTPKGVSFGMNLIPRGTGRIARGDAVVVLD
ncbi:MOSC domain-containing protein [Lysobacter sp. TY2-98]|uniref:MOSC domain-containing protein n=1 Tax=Lysobacter sp. TY2-98 TaxID=2290922 RepID=UPI000E2073CA|nr:MOSC N-terminal beta barrel domain-containing protein [Lysobacter sp. TY2-98]AXK72764.1 MOSC domain-containing protein [Lysobacter sp. TY2-98]